MSVLGTGDVERERRARRAQSLDAAARDAPTLAGGQLLAAEAAELRRSVQPNRARPMLGLPVFRN